MHYTTALLAVFAVASTAAPLATPDDCAETPQRADVLKSLSAVFTSQLAGLRSVNPLLNQNNDICNAGHGGVFNTWANSGLTIPQEPLCHSETNATDAYPYAVSNNTKLYTTLIMNSFDSENKKAWTYLCHNLRYKQLSAFFLDSEAIIEKVCNAGNTPQSPEPFEPVPGATGSAGPNPNSIVNASAVQDFNQYATGLLALPLRVIQSQLNDKAQVCGGSLPEGLLQALDSLQLDRNAYRDNLCQGSGKEPLSPEQLRDAVLNLLGKQYVVVLKNISNVPGYDKWLCDNVNVDAMNKLGLNGTQVRDSVCC